MNPTTIHLKVNGNDHDVQVQPQQLLVDCLRYDLGLTGTKEGCSVGVCGACTVLLDGRPVLSCIHLAALAEGHEVTTIEGLRPLHQAAGGEGCDPVQDAFDRCGALQCGFCQSGMMLSARALLDHVPVPTEDETRAALAGNLCRCTGDTQIFQAIERAACERAGLEPTRPAWAPDEAGKEA